MGGARPDTWMPLYWGDYLRDTMHLRAEAHGAYLLLICHYWMSGKPLPDDDDHLSAVARVDEEAWRRLRPKLSEFFLVENGKWLHSRIESELAKAKHITEVRRTSGKEGGKRSANAKQPSKQTNKQTPQQTATPSQPPSPLSNSVSNETGADAPLASMLVRPLCLVRPVERDGKPDWSHALFRQGLDWLAKATEKPPDKLRSLIAKWQKAAGPEKVFRLLAECETREVAEPVEYIAAALHDDDEFQQALKAVAE